MKDEFQFRELARVLFHMDSGYTKVSLTRTEGLGLADGGIEWDIPTQDIPRHLRAIGSRFYVTAKRRKPDENDKPDDLRNAFELKIVEEEN